MPIAISLAPLGLIVETVRPEVSAATVNTRVGTVPGLKQRRGVGSVVGGALLVEGDRLPDAERMRDLVHRRPLRGLLISRGTR